MHLRDLKTWQRALLVNITLLVGIALSAFILPSNTPVWSWACICAVVFLSLNYFFLRRPKTPNPGRSWLANIIIWLGTAILLLDLIFRRWLAH
jgi:hypothetical protein